MVFHRWIITTPKIKKKTPHFQDQHDTIVAQDGWEWSPLWIAATVTVVERRRHRSTRRNETTASEPIDRSSRPPWWFVTSATRRRSSARGKEHEKADEINHMR